MNGLFVPVDLGHVQLFVGTRNYYVFISINLEQFRVSQRCVTKDHVISVELQAVLRAQWQAESPINVFSFLWLGNAAPIGHQRERDLQVLRRVGLQ